jgi:hypothetical protein
MKNSIIQKKKNEIEKLQRRMNKIVFRIQEKQEKLREEISELMMIDEEANSIINYQWDINNIENIDKNLK